MIRKDNFKNVNTEISVNDRMGTLLLNAKPQDFISVIKILKEKYGIGYNKQAEVMQISKSTLYKCLDLKSHETVLTDQHIKNGYFRLLTFYCL